jgi:hypothetical protein
VAEDVLCYIKATAKGRRNGNFPITISRDIVHKYKPYYRAGLDEQEEQVDG